MSVLARPEVVVGILSLIGTLIGSIAGIMTANKLTIYRIEQLEKKVEAHNSIVERVYKLEGSDQAQWKRIDEMKGKV